MLTVIIPTAGRKQSLRETLVGLSKRTGSVAAEVIVVDNAKQPELGRSDVAVDGLGRVRLLHEPRPGKSSALNRALHSGVGEIIAVLDDDMSPMPGWMDTVVASVHSRPQFDVFSGGSHVVWPEGLERPAWAGHALARGLAFSVVDPCESDREMGAGGLAYPSGNHFWFRRAVLASVPTFPDVWPPETEFVLAARASGHRGVFVPEVTCGHRIQPGLVDVRAFVDRARRFGWAQAYFHRPRGAAESAKGLRASCAPALWRAKWLVWWIRYHRARLQPSAEGVPARARAMMHLARFEAMIHHGRAGTSAPR